MEITGKIKEFGELQTFDSGFEKKIILITTDEKYPKDIAIEFWTKEIPMLDDFELGVDVKCYVNISSKEYNGRYYTNIHGWKIEQLELVEKVQEEIEEIEETKKDLPF